MTRLYIIYHQIRKKYDALIYKKHTIMLEMTYYNIITRSILEYDYNALKYLILQ